MVTVSVMSMGGGDLSKGSVCRYQHQLRRTFQSRRLSGIQTAAFLGYRNINLGDGARHYICRSKQLDKEENGETAG